MPIDHSAGEQAQLWNGSAGRAWVALQALLDDLFAPFERLLLDAVERSGSRRVLDVGCGSGALTLALARRLGATARALGVDISAPLIAAARVRAERESSRAEFMQGDAQDCAFEPAAFDMVVSRFGVMFFDDPVAAFANLRRACSRDARLRLIAWRSAQENPFMAVAERAAARWMPHLPPRAAHAPGQFAFADAAHVARVLDAAGWREAAIEPIDVHCGLPTSALESYITHMGPVGRFLAGVQDPALRAEIVSALRAAFEPYVEGDHVRFVAACWQITVG